MATPIRDVVETNEMLPPVEAPNAEGWRACCDDKVRTSLGSSAEEIEWRWHTGENDEVWDDPDHSDVGDLAMFDSVDREEFDRSDPSLSGAGSTIHCVRDTRRPEPARRVVQSSAHGGRPGVIPPCLGQLRLDLSILDQIERVRSDARPPASMSRRAGYRHQVRQTDDSEAISSHRHRAGRAVRIPFRRLPIDRGVGTIEITARAHVSTGRVPLGAVVAFLIRELGFRPLRPDQQTILRENQAAFDASRPS